MASQTAVRCLGHPGLRQICASVNVNKLQHESIRTICRELKETMLHYGARSISAVQLGYPYRMFAMETVFYEDFEEEKTDFEKLFLSTPQSETALEQQSEEMNAYLGQLQFHLQQHVPYEQDLSVIEQQLENGNPSLTGAVPPLIVINPTWTPLDLDQSIFEFEQGKGNLSGPGDNASEAADNNGMYTTLLFGCNGVRVSSNYEQCVSCPELMVKKTRVNRIRTEFYDENGRKRICYLKSQDARLFQHECDHLDGRMMTDDAVCHDDSSVLCVDEYLRRQQILKPQLEQLIAKFGPSQQNALYRIYDPLHPPCDEELVEMLQHILDKKEQQQQHMTETVRGNVNM